LTTNPTPTNVTVTINNAQVTSATSYTDFQNPSLTAADLAVSSNQFTVPVGGEVVFVKMTALPSGWGLPFGWSDADIGGPGRPGYATFNPDTGTWSVAGGGSDIWSTSDQFHFASEHLAGDGSIVARVTSVENTDRWAKAGVMFRDSSNPSAVFADVMATPGNGVTFQWRATAGAVPSSVNVPGITAPVWVELTRVGNSFSAFSSSDGISWTQLGTTETVIMNSTALVGLAVTAHNNNLLNTSTFDNVSVFPRLQFTVAPAVTAGVPFNITVTVQDGFNHTATGYTGTVHFTASNGAQADYTFTPGDMGTHTFNVTLVHAGTLTVTAMDTGGTGAAGTTQITVTAAPATTLVVASFPLLASQGQAYTFTVTAYDAYDNVATGYTGTISFSSDDTSASLPPDYTFTAADAGVQTFTAAFYQTGTFYLRATDSMDPSITGEEDNIVVTQ
jgi:hypothetical protein